MKILAQDSLRTILMIDFYQVEGKRRYQNYENVLPPINCMENK